MQRTRRRWRAVGVDGITTSDDIVALQLSVKDYQSQLQAVIADAIAKGWEMPYHNEPRSAQTWADLASRVDEYVHEEPAWVFTGGQYDRGRAFVSELDGWRDWLAAQKVPNVPAPLPVPATEVSIPGAIGWGLAAIVAILALRELH